MVLYEIKNIKDFMNILFAGNAFDKFYVTECEIVMATQISISGKRSKAWAEENENSSYCKWMELKGIVYNVIRGNKSPSLLKIVFSQKDVENEIEAGILTLKFQDAIASITTGYVRTDFSLDKTAENQWDKDVEFMLENCNIQF